ncbi:MULTISPECIES: hypothetical protein [unclassified Brevibacillus]|uniref:hypothetical protein n=1 Tax=Brevibacillus TaxID=55080 RepID=UPI00156B5A6C|nr:MULTISPECIES: hypothetical protein [unclassified Brevibacillus]NRQ56526.1 hypothetical protein [Brevibacillus sp. HD1.4A]UED69195.1 hypothetical protein HP435_00340 [Brevibacillus sp. HD3.3A]
MKRFIYVAIAASMLVIGCSPGASEPVASKDTPPAGKQEQQPNPAPQDEGTKPEQGSEEAKEGNETTTDDAPNGSKIIIDGNFLKQLASNEINGFDIAIGMTKQEVIELYGRVIKEDYYDGGRYQAFENLSGGIVYFDGKNRVYAIDLAGEHLNQTNLNVIRQQLGTPVAQGQSMVDEKFDLYYEAGENSVFISAKDEHSPVEKIRIINKKMLDESPQD